MGREASSAVRLALYDVGTISWTASQPVDRPLGAVSGARVARQEPVGELDLSPNPLSYLDEVTSVVGAIWYSPM